MKSSEPLQVVRRFAAELGWNGLEQTAITLTPEICGDLAPGTRVTCFSTSHLRFFLQINQAVPGTFGAYNVAVVPTRYAIRPLAFEPCQMETRDDALREARRLFSLFGRANFRNPQWRRRYLESHPHGFLRGKKKWRGWKARIPFRDSTEIRRPRGSP